MTRMHCFVYKSCKRPETYLYLSGKDDFTPVPQNLRATFGEAEFVMAVDLSKREKLARVDIGNVRAALREMGYYLQMPPANPSIAAQSGTESDL